MNKIKTIFLWVIAIVSHFSTTLVHAQSKEIVSVSTKPFSDGVNHWYYIKDKNNIINPLPDQRRYSDYEYKDIADNILLFQLDNGGWAKNYDMSAILTRDQIRDVVRLKSTLHTTFDNEATYTHIFYLAQVYSLTNNKKYKEGCLKGVEFVLEAQYANGGWPQYYPLENNYSRHITFNDGAYMGIMELLGKIVNGDPVFSFVDEALKERVAGSYQKGIDCILNMQILDNGRLTAWCQQHDEISLSPAWARKFEPPSICNGESVPIVLFLMNIDNPNERVVNAVQSAVKWFEDSKIYNTRVESFEIEPTESKYKQMTKDVRIVSDTTAPPIWTRYYELGTDKPLFCDRDSKFVYSLAEVGLERRNGYAWYVSHPNKVLKAYPRWQKKWIPAVDVLKAE